MDQITANSKSSADQAAAAQLTPTTKADNETSIPLMILDKLGTPALFTGPVAADGVIEFDAKSFGQPIVISFADGNPLPSPDQFAVPAGSRTLYTPLATARGDFTFLATTGSLPRLLAVEVQQTGARRIGFVFSDEDVTTSTHIQAELGVVMLDLVNKSPLDRTVSLTTGTSEVRTVVVNSNQTLPVRLEAAKYGKLATVRLEPLGFIDQTGGTTQIDIFIEPG